VIVSWSGRAPITPAVFEIILSSESISAWQAERIKTEASNVANEIRLNMIVSYQLRIQSRPVATGLGRSKANAMDSEITRNQKYDNDYANDGKDIHFAHSHSVMIARGVVIATGYIPNIRRLRRAGRAREQ
jgi:hypothetical protein